MVCQRGCRINPLYASRAPARAPAGGNFIVDTGAVTTVLSHSMAAKLGVTENTPGARVDLGLAGVGGMEGVVLRVPDVTFKTAQNSEVYPQVVSINLQQISKMIGTEISGVVGYDFLQNYKLVAELHDVRDPAHQVDRLLLPHVFSEVDENLERKSLLVSNIEPATETGATSCLTQGCGVGFGFGRLAADS